MFVDVELVQASSSRTMIFARNRIFAGPFRVAPDTVILFRHSSEGAENRADVFQFSEICITDGTDS